MFGGVLNTTLFVNITLAVIVFSRVTHCIPVCCLSISPENIREPSGMTFSVVVDKQQQNRITENLFTRKKISNTGL